MDAQVFWAVIGNYNQQTRLVQAGLICFLVLSAVLSYTQTVKWAAKFALGITNLYLAVVFFAWNGTEPIQRYFALPLFLLCGVLFLYEAWHSREDPLEKPGPWQIFLLLLYLAYPLFSVLLGNRFPQMVTHIMPCPVVSLSLAVYSGYRRKNKWLLALLTVWGLTGIKSILFRAYEDIILLICGLYGVVLLAKERKKATGGG